MNYDMITSKQNNIIKLVKKLISSSKYRKSENKFVLEGLRLCKDIVMNDAVNKSTPSLLFFTKSAYEKSSDDIDRIGEKCDKCYLISDDVLKTISDTVNPQGVLCVMNMPDMTDVRLSGCGRYMVLHNISNPDNVGAISRSAEAFGLDGIITVGGCDIYNPKATRASMGALLRLTVLDMSDDELFDECKEKCIKTYASTPRATATPIDKCGFDTGCAVLIGNEANGLSDDIIDRCDCAVTIPMKGRAESLNAAAAAAVLAYAMTL